MIFISRLCARCNDRWFRNIRDYYFSFPACARDATAKGVENGEITQFSFPACARDATDDYSLQAVSTVCNIVCANLLFRFGNSLIFRS